MNVTNNPVPSSEEMMDETGSEEEKEYSKSCQDDPT